MLVELIATCALAAEPELTVEPLSPARSGGLLRVAVRTRDTPSVPLSLDVALLDGETRLAVAVTTLPPGCGEATLVLTPAGLGGRPLHLHATASWTIPGQPPRALTASAAVTTPGAVLSQVIATVERLRASGRSDPLPWLWAEQVAELGASNASAASVGEVATLGARLSAWLADPRIPPPGPSTNELALRDPVDDSVQPFRLHLPAGAGPHPVLMLLPPAVPSLGKARWPTGDARLIDAANAAGLAVVMCYPAGDRDWSGAARRRVALTLAAAAAVAPLDLEHGACVGIAGKDGLPYALHRPPATADTAWCRAILGPRLPVVPGTAWSDAPFAVVIGSAEHAAAVSANRALAEGFRSAYADHAHAVIELLDDRVEPARLAGRNLVLIGNPRSNRVLAGLGLDLPWRWDHRMVRNTDGTGSLRTRMAPLVCRTRLPDGRTVIILDGPVPEWGGGLPLAHLR